MLRSRTGLITLLFIGVALACLPFSDMAVTTQNPWRELERFALGMVTPNFMALDSLFTAFLRTLAFAFTGVALGSVAGFFLATLFGSRLIRAFCAVIRSIHELFWALIFMQSFGIHPLAGVLAIAIPFAGIFGKVYAEIIEEADPLPARAIPRASSRIARYLFTQVPEAWPHLRTYTAYRLECGLRSSAVLGFIGLPTLGYYLESGFSQGHYSEVGALLILFYVLIATMRLWLRPRLVPFYLAAAPFGLGDGMPIIWSNVTRFFTEDIVPRPLREGEGWEGMQPWLSELLIEEALPGIWNTLLLTQMALVVTGVLALLAFPLISTHFGGPVRRTSGHVLLVVARSTPEYILAYILLQLWGPSMLPAVVALALHNGGIIGHLIGRMSNEVTLRKGASNGVNRYAWELLPRVYPPFLAFLFYRWEIIMRETAILGILGITTLGFYVEGAIQEIRFDQAMVLILITALLNLGVDALSRRIRAWLRLRTRPTCEA
ncbi:MAG: ABC transporter permease [Halospina sp.]